MNLSHFTAMLIFAVLVSAVLAIITKSTTEEQIRYGVKTFALFIAAAIIIGWLMYPLPL